MARAVRAPVDPARSKRRYEFVDHLYYDLEQDRYWVSRAAVFSLLGVLREFYPHNDPTQRQYLTQNQVDWLHDNDYIIA